MRRFELVEGTSSKFWEIAVSGKVLTTRWGRIGTAGSAKQVTLASPAAATAEHDKLVREKTRKGYREQGGGAAKAKAGTVAAKAGAAAAKGGGAAAAAATKAAAAAPAVDPRELVLTQLHAGGGRLGQVVIDGRFALAVGDGCFATTDGKTFHRRLSPGRAFGLASIDGALYASGDPVAVSRDRGARWKEIAVPFQGYRFCTYRDAEGTWWMGCDDGVILTSKQPERGWKQARFALRGKVLVIAELAGKLIFAGTGGGGAWDGKQLRPLSGFKKTDIVTRITEAPSGALVAIGDDGIAYRSTDGGARWAPVRTGVAQDLEDCAWVAGALFVVGGSGGWSPSAAVVLRSTNEGKTFTKVPAKISSKLWGIASWGDGAFLCGDDGALWRLAAPKDAYWKGAADELAPPPPAIDEVFAPRGAAPLAERERTHARLLGEALRAAEAASERLRAARPADESAGLAQLVDEAPDADTSAAQVYADWLQGQGDPRGDLAAMQLQREADPKRKDLQRAEQALLAQHAERWLGELAAYGDLLELRWRAGFLHAARLANTLERSELHDSGAQAIDLEAVLGALLDAPSARFLRELTVGIVTYEDNDYGGVARVLGKRYLPSLRSLFLGDFHSEETELNWSTLGNLQPMYAALPNLRSLRLRSGSMQLGSIVLPRLERFEVITGGLDSRAAKAIAAAAWPGLRALSIQVGPARRGGSGLAKAKDFQPVLDGAGLPRLVHLGLTNLDYTDALIEPLAHGKLLPQLEELDLKMGALSDDGARLLYRYQKAFVHLRHINVDDNFLTRDGIRLLKATKLPFHFGDQRDDEGDPENRYASAYE